MIFPKKQGLGRLYHIRDIFNVTRGMIILHNDEHKDRKYSQKRNNMLSTKILRHCNIYFAM